MNSSNVAAGVGGSSLTAMLATLIQYWQGVDNVGVASAEASLIVMTIGATGAWLRWWVLGKSLDEMPPSIVNGLNKSPSNHSSVSGTNDTSR